MKGTQIEFRGDFTESQVRIKDRYVKIYFQGDLNFAVNLRDGLLLRFKINPLGKILIPTSYILLENKSEKEIKEIKQKFPNGVENIFNNKKWWRLKGNWVWRDLFKSTQMGKIKRGESRRSCDDREKLYGELYICSYSECKEEKDLEVHHIIPLSEGGNNDKKNLQFLCKKHHRVKHINLLLKEIKNEMIELKKEKKVEKKLDINLSGIEKLKKEYKEEIENLRTTPTSN